MEVVVFGNSKCWTAVDNSQGKAIFSSRNKQACLPSATCLVCGTHVMQAWREVTAIARGKCNGWHAVDLHKFRPATRRGHDCRRRTPSRPVRVKGLNVLQVLIGVCVVETGNCWHTAIHRQTWAASIA